MCNPISLILTEDKVFLPPEKSWEHSHYFIMEKNNIPDGLMGDKYLRLEVVPPEEIFRNKETNEKLEVDDTWKVNVDEKNIPDWYLNDRPNQEYRAREAAKKWFQKFPDNLLDGYKETAGDDAQILAGCYSTINAGDISKLISGYDSVLTAGNNSILIAGSYSTLTAGYGSELTAGNYSKLTADDYSQLTARSNSIFCAGKGSRFILHWYSGNKYRISVAYTGENGIEPNKKYLGTCTGNFTEVKTKAITKKKSNKKNTKKKKVKKRK